jgi:UDP-glucose 4-epimerase
MSGSILITGAGGFLGRRVVAALAGSGAVVASDLRVPPPSEQIDGVSYAVLDICEADIEATLTEHDIGTVVHLAAIVSPGPGQDRAFQYRVDVEGTARVVDACVAAGVKRLIYASSGAAYGYHPDNGALLDEQDPLRGNEVFAYSWHKRLAEERLEQARLDHPELEQVVFRVCTILGPDVDNQITAMFERPVVMGLKGSATPFCFVWDEDVAAAVVRATEGGPPGVYNLAGDGVLTLREIADAMGRRYVSLPESIVRRALSVLHPRGLAPYGPEQTLFLLHRPVLGNRRLREEFGFRPRRTSREVFETYRASRAEA